MKKSEIIAKHEREAQSSANLGHFKSVRHYENLAAEVRSGKHDAGIIRYHGADAIDC
jgi:hypothetical protein